MKSKWVLGAMLLVVATGGCRVQVDKSKDGEDKNVKIDTPLGGLHVRKNDVGAVDMGVPVYPGAQLSTDKENDKSADIHFGFGEWQLRVKAVNYHTDDSKEQVLAFYQKALGRFGDVIRCHGKSPVGSPQVTREGLTCSDDDEGKHVHTSASTDELSLKAGSKRHQHLMVIKTGGDAGTRFALIELELPKGSNDSRETN
jgi:hypothetical protein